MSLDLETLRAFADGELPPQRRAEVEAVLAGDTEQAALAAAMFASRLPYRSAFEQQALPPVPAELQARVAELAAVALGQHALVPAQGQRGFAPQRSAKLLPALPTLMGLTGLMAATVGVVAGYWAAGAIAAARQPTIEPWLRSAVAYHAMYARETVTDGGADPRRQLEVLRKVLRESHGLALHPPDLSAQGLQFVRAQRLHFKGRMVLQLVYLPQQGGPLALCLMQAPAQPERAFTLDGQQAFSWQAGGWSHVLIGSLPPGQMRAIRQQLPPSAVQPTSAAG